MLVPRPTSFIRLPGETALTADTAVHAPAAPEVAALLRELLDLPLPESGSAGPGTISLRLADAPELDAEGYTMHATADGIAVVAANPAGLRWAAQTLAQLAPVVPHAQITDIPRYPWRGAMLDLARWCHPMSFVYKYVDLLARHKLNTLHLHLTDDQGWRFEVRKYPRLAEVGGFRRESSAGHGREGRLDGTPHGGFYTQNELRDLVTYAARRGVRVVPEIDLPGHTQAAIAAYPKLGNQPSRILDVRTTWGISTHVLNVEDSTVDFVRDVLDEVCDVFPYEYVHVGGDEVPPDEWAASPAAQARAAAAGLSGVDGLLGWWVRLLGAHLARNGRKLAAWDEVLDTGPPEGTTVFAWRGVERVAAARSAGLDVVAAPYTHTYLDYAETDLPGEPLAIGGPLPLSTVYGYDPGDVLGIQGQLWSEYLPTPQLVEWRAFPRLAAIAEVGWSGPGGDIAGFRERLAVHLPRLEALGVNYRPLDPPRP